MLFFCTVLLTVRCRVFILELILSDEVEVATACSKKVRNVFAIIAFLKLFFYGFLRFFYRKVLTPDIGGGVYLYDIVRVLV